MPEVGRAFAWQASAQVVNRASLLLVVVVLVRVLDPLEAALVTALVVVVGWVETVAGAGHLDAVIYFPDDQGTRRRLWRWGILLAGASGLIVVAAGPVAAAVLDHSGRSGPFRALAVSAVLIGLAAVTDGRLRKHLHFRTRAVAEIIRSVARLGGLAVGVGLGLDAWSFVVALAVGDLAFLLTTGIAARALKPGAVGEPADGAAILRFGLLIGASLLAGRLIADADFVAIGLHLGAAELAAYILAFRIVEMAVLGPLATVATVAYPLYRRDASTGEVELADRYAGVLSVLTLWATGFGLVLGFNAEFVLRLLYSERWAESGAVVGWLCAYAVARSWGAGTVDVYKALGRPWVATAVTVIRALVVAPLVFIAARHSLVAVAATLAVVSLFLSFGMQLALVKLVGDPGLPRKILAALRPSAVLAVPVLAVAAVAAVLGAPPPATGLLVVVTTVGGAVHIVAGSQGIVRQGLAR